METRVETERPPKALPWSLRKIMVVYIMVVALERREGGKKGRRIELYFGGTIVSRICLNHERDDTIVT